MNSNKIKFHENSLISPGKKKVFYIFPESRHPVIKFRYNFSSETSSIVNYEEIKSNRYRVEFNFHANRARSGRFAHVYGLNNGAKLLSRRACCVYANYAASRFTSRREVDGTRTPTTAARDKRFIVLSFYAPDSVECELHYFSSLALLSRACCPDTIYKSP